MIMVTLNVNIEDMARIFVWSPKSEVYATINCFERIHEQARSTFIYIYVEDTTYQKELVISTFLEK